MPSGPQWLVGLAGTLVVGGAAGIVLIGTNTVYVDGGHGLVRWFALSACATSAIGGALLAVGVMLGTPEARRGARFVAMLGIAVFAAFVTAWGMPFVP